MSEVPRSGRIHACRPRRLGATTATRGRAHPCAHRAGVMCESAMNVLSTVPARTVSAGARDGDSVHTRRGMDPTPVTAGRSISTTCASGLERPTVLHASAGRVAAGGHLRGLFRATPDGPRHPRVVRPAECGQHGRRNIPRTTGARGQPACGHPPRPAGAHPGRRLAVASGTERRRPSPGLHEPDAGARRARPDLARRRSRPAAARVEALRSRSPPGPPSRGSGRARRVRPRPRGLRAAQPVAPRRGAGIRPALGAITSGICRPGHPSA